MIRKKRKDEDDERIQSRRGMNSYNEKRSKAARKETKERERDIS
jgi:hypothetical protein